jgi:pyridoxal phosphate enzyme (YggS family)
LETTTPDIKANLQAVRARIAAATMAAGRDPGSVRLIAVSKYQPVTSIQQAIAAGQTAFGENTVQEALTRQALMADPVTEWHFIGHLQTNKAKHIAGHFAWLHTLDSIKLARKLSASTIAGTDRLKLLLQINISKDPDKFGLLPDAVYPFVEEFLEADLPGVCLRGLMTIGRREATAAERMDDFSGLHALRDACAGQFGAEHFRELSMGMSHDFEAAIRAGATMVRVGSAIFGPRPVARH